MKLHPEYIMKNGRRISVVLPYKEFKAIQERLQDIQDLQVLNEAKQKEGRKKSTPFSQVKKDLGL
jgi:hypothetical protein